MRFWWHIRIDKHRLIELFSLFKIQFNIQVVLFKLYIFFHWGYHSTVSHSISHFSQYLSIQFRVNCTSKFDHFEAEQRVEYNNFQLEFRMVLVCVTDLIVTSKLVQPELDGNQAILATMQLKLNEQKNVLDNVFIFVSCRPIRSNTL